MPPVSGRSQLGSRILAEVQRGCTGENGSRIFRVQGALYARGCCARKVLNVVTKILRRRSRRFVPQLREGAVRAVPVGVCRAVSSTALGFCT
jgi:hypothetical protein